MDREPRDRRANDKRRADHAPTRRLLRRKRHLWAVARDFGRWGRVLFAGE